MEVYKGLGDPEQRERFLTEFEEAGSGRGSGSLKFALSFSQTLAQETSVSTTLKEIWLTRPAWGLGLMGVCVGWACRVSRRHLLWRRALGKSWDPACCLLQRRPKACPGPPGEEVLRCILYFSRSSCRGGSMGLLWGMHLSMPLPFCLSPG